MGYYKNLFIFLMNNPFLISLLDLISSGIVYIGTGIKAGILISGLTVILSFQFFVKRIKLTQLVLFIPISFVLLATLIGSTIFRGNLGLDGFMQLQCSINVKVSRIFSSFTGI